ncbi:MAG: PKD domain-containing protein, partial [Bacteroidota bacterium]
ASITLEVFPQVMADYDFTYNIGCDAADEDGMTVAFRATDLNASFFSWDFGDGSPVSNEREPVHVYNVPEGETRRYTVRLYVAGVAACDQTVIEQDLVVTNQRPEARFISVPETPTNLFIPQADVQFQNNSTGAENYFWRFGDGQVSTEENPVHAYETAGTYDVKLTVTDANGCTDVYTDGPYVVDAEELDLPTVFTPNEDGVNDRWHIGYTGTKPYEVKILSRQGQLVYSATDMNDQGWDGTLDNGEEAPEGVYFYVADIEGKIYKGNFTLLR